MPVDNYHTQYASYLPKWQRVRDCIAGEDAVKKGGTLYLPKLGGQTAKQYEAYKDRASFYGATGRTRDGLLGAIFRKEPQIALPAALEGIRYNVDLAGTSAADFAREVAEEVLSVGRYGVLTEVPAEKRDAAGRVVSVQRPYLFGYRAEQIINWRTRVVNGVTIVDQVILHESFTEAAEDGFGSMMRERFRVLELDEDHKYQQRVFTRLENGDLSEELIIPQSRAQRLGFIPFNFIGPFSLSPDIQKPPLLDLVNVNLGHYRNSADNEHGLHWTALPTPIVKGVEEATGAFHIGSQTAWNLPGGNADAKMLEFTGAGMGALREEMRRKEGLMALLGARLLEEQKKAAETAESKRLQYSGDNSILASIANTVSNGITENLRWAAAWHGTNGDIHCKLNTDFFDVEIEPSQISAIIQAWQAGIMSRRTAVWNLHRGEMLPPDVEPEDEEEKIDNEGPALGGLEDFDDEGGAGAAALS